MSDDEGLQEFADAFNQHQSDQAEKIEKLTAERDRYREALEIERARKPNEYTQWLAEKCTRYREALEKIASYRATDPTTMDCPDCSFGPVQSQVHLDDCAFEIAFRTLQASTASGRCCEAGFFGDGHECRKQPARCYSRRQT